MNEKLKEKISDPIVHRTTEKTIIIVFSKFKQNSEQFLGFFGFSLVDTEYNRTEQSMI